MNSKKKICFLSIFLFVGCTKDHLNIDSNCSELPPAPIAGWNYQLDSVNYTFPFFNPSNSNEILYQKQESSGHKNLYKYNLLTKQKQIIFSDENYYQPKWGKNEWILLNPQDGNIWKIKSNGDSLIQLTFTNGDFAPEWNITSDKFSIYRTIGTFSKTVILDRDGNELDTLDNYYSSQSSWQHPYFMATANEYGLRIINAETDTVAHLITQQEPSLTSAIWLSDQINIIYTAENGIFKINSQTKNISVIKSSCSTRKYLFPSYSPQSNKIIFQRVDLQQLNSSTVSVKIGLYMMNTDGSDEHEVRIE